ncbi:bifunctional aspartokinase II/homoserine dehydrogenase [Salmonella enterica subsp. enterica serovar Typhimurium]
MSVIAQAGAKGRQLHKFGGSSLADVKCYLRVAGIMAEYSQPDDMMVVSAAGSTTNQLISWLKLSQTDRLSAHQVLQTLRRYQCDLISGLLPADAADDLTSAFISDLERLAALLDGGVTDAVYAEIVGHGEIWSARLMSAVLNQQGLDAAWLERAHFYAPNAPHSRRLMKGYLILYCSSYWRSIRANVWS